MEHTLSQFGKTIKKALKSTTKERQLLHTRSAVQCFPVVEWRQQTEDFHKRSISASCRITGADAWRKMDGDVNGMAPIQHPGDWDPIQQEDPTRPARDPHEQPCSQREASVKRTSPLDNLALCCPTLQTEIGSPQICLWTRLTTTRLPPSGSITPYWRGRTDSLPPRISTNRTHPWNNNRDNPR
jgi:hypothetical protein